MFLGPSKSGGPGPMAPMASIDNLLLALNMEICLKMIMYHRNIVLTFYLQKIWEQLAQKLLRYGHFSAAT